MCKFLVLAALTIPLLSSAANATEPQIGDTWYRPRVGFIKTLEYQEGPTAGSATGNPNTDIHGNSPWHLDRVSASNSSTWFQTTPTALVWDPTGTGGGSPGRWLKSNDLYPSIDYYSLCHFLGSTSGHNNGGTAADNAPIIRWTYPGSSPSHIKISGRVGMMWGWLGMPSPWYTEKVTGHIVIYHYKSSDSSWHQLFDESATNTNDGTPSGTIVHDQDYDASGTGTSNSGGRCSRAWNLSSYSACNDVRVESGDSIVWSIRGHMATGSNQNWVSMVDTEMEIVVFVPSNPCESDFNGDGEVDFFDYLDFVDAFSQGCD